MSETGVLEKESFTTALVEKKSPLSTIFFVCWMLVALAVGVLLSLSVFSTLKAEWFARISSLFTGVTALFFLYTHAHSQTRFDKFYFYVGVSLLVLALVIGLAVIGPSFLSTIFTNTTVDFSIGITLTAVGGLTSIVMAITIFYLNLNKDYQEAGPVSLPALPGVFVSPVSGSSQAQVSLNTENTEAPLSPVLSHTHRSADLVSGELPHVDKGVGTHSAIPKMTAQHQAQWMSWIIEKLKEDFYFDPATSRQSSGAYASLAEDQPTQIGEHLADGMIKRYRGSLVRETERLTRPDSLSEVGYEPEEDPRWKTCLTDVQRRRVELLMSPGDTLEDVSLD